MTIPWIDRDQAKRIAAATTIAVALAGPAEGIRRVWYFDPVGIPTVCMGHTGADIDKNKVYTDAECDALMTADMKDAVATVERCVPGLPPKVLGSFADAVFNGGPKIACDKANSTAARYLAAGEYDAACRQHPRWNKARKFGVLVELPGLTKRANLRMNICLS